MFLMVGTPDQRASGWARCVLANWPMVIRPGLAVSERPPLRSATKKEDDHVASGPLLISVPEFPDERSLMAAARFLRAAPFVSPWRLTWRTLPSQSRSRVTALYPLGATG